MCLVSVAREPSHGARHPERADCAKWCARLFDYTKKNLRQREPGLQRDRGSSALLEMASQKNPPLQEDNRAWEPEGGRERKSFRQGLDSGVSGMGVGIPPSSFPWAGAEFSLRCHSICTSPEQAGVLRLLTDPTPSGTFLGESQRVFTTPRPLPWLASAAEVSGPQGTELLTCEDSGCRGDWCATSRAGRLQVRMGKPGVCTA